MATPKKKYGYNQEPRLSANQLAEYLNATPNRRKGIVRDAKYPKTSIVARYDGAWDAITKYLCNDGRPSIDLVEAMERQKTREKKPGATPWVQQDARLSIEAIDAFMKSYNKLGLTKLSCKPITGAQPKLSISGVDISVSLDATTHRNGAADGPRVGGMILVFSKAEASTAAREQRCRTSAVLRYPFCGQTPYRERGGRSQALLLARRVCWPHVPGSRQLRKAPVSDGSVLRGGRPSLADYRSPGRLRRLISDCVTT